VLRGAKAGSTRVCVFLGQGRRRRPRRGVHTEVWRREASGHRFRRRPRPFRRIVTSTRILAAAADASLARIRAVESESSAPEGGGAKRPFATPGAIVGGRNDAMPSILVGCSMRLRRGDAEDDGGWRGFGGELSSSRDCRARRSRRSPRAPQRDAGLRPIARVRSRRGTSRFLRRAAPARWNCEGP